MSLIFTAHLPPRADPADTLLVEDRWRIGAFLFPVLWALWHGHWALFAGFLALAAGVGALAGAGLGALALALDLAVRLAAGLESGALIRLDRRLRGWRELGAVDAADPDEAELRWFLRDPPRRGPWGAAWAR